MKQITVRFKTEEAAKDFALAFASSGGEATIHENAQNGIRSVTVVSSSSRAISFVREVAKDMHESINCRKYAHGLLRAINEAVESDMASEVLLMDGGKVALSPRNAGLLSRLHDRLDESRQASFLVFACESKSSHEHALGFALTNERD